MKLYLKVLMISVAVACYALPSIPAFAGPYEDAIEASRAGKYEQAFQMLKRLADQGDARAAHQVGMAFEYARGTTSSFTEAAKYYRIAAIKGSAGSQTNLGLLYLKGKGLPKNRDTAIYWLKKSQAQGGSIAKNKLDELKVPYQPVQFDGVHSVTPRKEKTAKETAASVAKITQEYEEYRRKLKEKKEQERLRVEQGAVSTSTYAPNKTYSWKDQQRNLTRRINRENRCKNASAYKGGKIGYYVGRGKNSQFISCN